MRADASTREIIGAVAARHAVSMAMIMGGARDRKTSWARQEAYAEIRRAKPNLSLPAIGRIFWRDHTTVLYGIRTFEARQASAVPSLVFAAVHSAAQTVPVAGCPAHKTNAAIGLG